MKSYTAIVEKCPDTGLYVGYVPGFPGAHSQADTLDELRAKLIGLLNAPATKIARTIKEPGGQLARVIQAKASQGDAA